MFARYLDVMLVIASAPFVLLAGMPRLGYLIGAGGWIVIALRRRVSSSAAPGARADTRRSRGAAPDGDPRSCVDDRARRARRALRRQQRRWHHRGRRRARRVHGRARDLVRAARFDVPDARRSRHEPPAEGRPRRRRSGSAAPSPSTRGSARPRKNNSYKPQDEFKLDNWVNLGIFSINKAVHVPRARRLPDLRRR